MKKCLTQAGEGSRFMRIGKENTMKLPRSIVEELDYAVASGWIGALLPGTASKATLSRWSKI